MAKIDETSARRVALGIAPSGGDVVPIDAANPLAMAPQVAGAPVAAANPLPTANQVGSVLNPGQANLGVAAVQIVPVRANRKAVIISAVAATAFYIGGSNAVTTGTGFFVPAGGSVTIETTSAVWGILAAGNLQVTALEIIA